MDKWWESSIVKCGEEVGKQHSYMWRSSGTAIELRVEKYWYSNTVICEDVFGEHYS